MLKKAYPHKTIAFGLILQTYNHLRLQKNDTNMNAKKRNKRLKKLLRSLIQMIKKIN